MEIHYGDYAAGPTSQSSSEVTGYWHGPIRIFKKSAATSKEKFEYLRRHINDPFVVEFCSTAGVTLRTNL